MNIWNKARQYGLVQFFRFALYELLLKWYYGTLRNSYSQLQEDVIIDRLLGYKKNGFYVDVGAFDPLRFSNTMRFYRRGWSGITIEPNTDLWRRFQKFRPRDINLNVGAGVKKSKLSFYHMNPATLSTFQSDQVKEYKKQGFSVVNVTKISVLPLREILRTYAKGKQIDFVSIDVEGMEMQVLKSNNWNTFRPKVICIESVDFPKSKKSERSYQPIDTYLKKLGYKRIHDNDLNTFYKNIRE